MPPEYQTREGANQKSYESDNLEAWSPPLSELINSARLSPGLTGQPNE